MKKNDLILNHYFYIILGMSIAYLTILLIPLYASAGDFKFHDKIYFSHNFYGKCSAYICEDSGFHYTLCNFKCKGYKVHPDNFPHSIIFPTNEQLKVMKRRDK